MAPRFGAVLLEVGFADIRLLVQRPPRTRQSAEAVAAEPWAVCGEFSAMAGYALKLSLATPRIMRTTARRR